MLWRPCELVWLITTWHVECWVYCVERSVFRRCVLTRGLPRCMLACHRLLTGELGWWSGRGKEKALGPSGETLNRQGEWGWVTACVLRGSQKQSRAREQRWSHTSAQDNTIMMGWLGGEAVGERKCTFATACSAMETNKVLHFVPSGKWIKALKAAPQLCTTVFTGRTLGFPT